MRDLRSWLKQVQELGELQVISREIDSDEETSALNYIVGQREATPALLYENIVGARPGFRASIPARIRRRSGSTDRRCSSMRARITSF